MVWLRQNTPFPYYCQAASARHVAPTGTRRRPRSASRGRQLLAWLQSFNRMDHGGGIAALCRTTRRLAVGRWQILGEQQASIKSGPRRHFVNM